MAHSGLVYIFERRWGPSKRREVRSNYHLYPPPSRRA